jgi:hypothetical protein
MNLKQELRYARESHERNIRHPIISSGSISYANWWKENPDEIWFTRFINHNCLACKENIRFYSVFGPRDIICEPFDGKKIFFSGENLEKIDTHGNIVDPVALRLFQKRQRDYGDYLCDNVDLSLGFARKDEENYLRVPLWITNFSPESSYDDIKKQINRINARQINVERTGAALIASHDQFGTREYIYNDLKDVVDIQCAGKWNHNTDLLRDKYGDGKIDYLFYKKFNICPENVDASGYVTEKLFDAFAAGTIPIYQGDGNNPEPKVINRNAVIFWNFESGNNEENIKLISKLDSDDDLYREFMMQPVFKEGAAEVVWSYFERLKNGLM